MRTDPVVKTSYPVYFVCEADHIDHIDNAQNTKAQKQPQNGFLAVELSPQVKVCICIHGSMTKLYLFNPLLV
jgi:hypothetical protein